VIEAVLEHLIEHGANDVATVFGRAFELAMQIERERFVRARPCEGTSERRGYANGYKSKRIDTPAGTVTVNVAETAGHEGEPFYPQSLERGRRSVRAVMLAVAEMIRTSTLSGGAGFANAVLGPSHNYEPPTYTFADGEEVGRDKIESIREIAEDCTHEINWQDGDVAVIDNTRIKHGRRAIVDAERQLYIGKGAL